MSNQKDKKTRLASMYEEMLRDEEEVADIESLIDAQNLLTRTTPFQMAHLYSVEYDPTSAWLLYKETNGRDHLTAKLDRKKSSELLQRLFVWVTKHGGVYQIKSPDLHILYVKQITKKE